MGSECNMRPSSGSCFHATVSSVYLLAEVAVRVSWVLVDLADKSMIGVRDVDKTLILHACDVWLLAKGGGVFIAAP
jgi:hypothetical protein